MKNIITDALIKTTITLTIIRIVVALLTRTIEESNFFIRIHLFFLLNNNLLENEKYLFKKYPTTAIKHIIKA
jgi:hypothetical protein